jgi:hypothetical protein
MNVIPKRIEPIKKKIELGETLYYNLKYGFEYRKMKRIIYLFEFLYKLKNENNKDYLDISYIFDNLNFLFYRKIIGINVNLNEFEDITSISDLDNLKIYLNYNLL